MTVNVVGGELPPEEIQQYIQRAETLHKGCTHLTIKADGDYVELEYTIPPFDRIRRITGYLVGTLDRFNDGKRAEEHDRVKHSIA